MILCKLIHRTRMIQYVELLIKLLKTIDEDTTIEIINNQYSIIHPLVNAVQYLANSCLIDIEGNASNNILILEKEGFKVFPVETDNFGWLTAKIQLRFGNIIFG